MSARVASAPGVFVDLDELVALRLVARDTTFLPRQPVRSLLAGRRASRVRGRGLDFEELRAYARGDDIRTMDWRVTARMQKPYVRTYREERERPVVLVVDQRASMFFGSTAAMKSVAAARLAALAAWRTVSVGDRVGAVIFGEREPRVLPARRNTKHVLAVLGALVEANRAAGTSQGARPSGARLDEALDEARSLAPHDALVCVLSDFRGASEKTGELLLRLRRHNDALVAWVTDALERKLPVIGQAKVSDGDAELTVPTSDTSLGERFAAAYASDRARVESFARDADMPWFELDAGGDVADQLRAAFGHRLRGAR